MGIFILHDFLVLSIWIFYLSSCNLRVGYGQSTFDVLQYGAKGDGHSDDTQAFLKAWQALCGASLGTATLMVPSGHTFLLQQIRFKGPCRSKNVHIKILGNLLAPQRNNWGGTCSKHWLHFVEIPSMTVDGSGVINGQGETWWSRNLTEGCTGIPTALLFERCDDLQISGLTHINGPSSHIYIVHSQDVSISRVNIHSPLGSHNTDGIDISNSVRVNIYDSIIGTGDDHIALKGGSQFINISNITCGPGHGISVGSIGEGGAEEFADHVNVWNCSFNGADSAARIKTWPGGRGYVKDITYKHITINETNYPIFIDQHYMRTPEKPNAVKVSDIIFSDIHGTCINENAIMLDCAETGCNNIMLDRINISSIDPNKSASAKCNNVQGTTTNIISPHVACIH